MQGCVYVCGLLSFSYKFVPRSWLNVTKTAFGGRMRMSSFVKNYSKAKVHNIFKYILNNAKSVNLSV